jgi:ABC-type glycerol-3-phosphate transport system substrate-binding protein
MYFTSCNGENDGSGNTEDELEGEILFSSNRTDFENTILRDYIDEFENKYPNTHIKVETIKDYIKIMKIKMNSNNLPDVWTVHGGIYTKDSLQNYNMNLNEEFPDLVNDYISTNIFNGTDGNVYALTTGMSYELVVYNKNIFKECNVETPEKLSEFISICKKINKSEYEALGMSVADDWILYNFFYTRPKEISGDVNILNKLIDYEEPFNKNNPVYKSYEILDLFVNEGIIKKDVLDYKWEVMKKDFQDGKIAMVIIGSWFISQVSEGNLDIDDIGVFPFPVDENNEFSYVVRGPDVGFAISKYSENEKLAKEFFLYITDKKCIDFAQSCGLDSPRKSKEINLKWQKELDSYNIKFIESVEDTSKLKEIINKIDFNQGEEIAKNIIEGKSIEEVFNELNYKWKNAK